MPIYEFACTNCRTLFSFYSRRVNTTTIPNCPNCNTPLTKQLSLFQAKSGKGDLSDPWGLSNDGCDEDPETAPDFDASNERVASAIADLGHKIDTMDYTDSAAASKLMRDFSNQSGIKFNKNVEAALNRLASGEDSSSAHEQLADALESGNPFAENSPQSKTMNSPFKKDPTLYEL